MGRLAIIQTDHNGFGPIEIMVNVDDGRVLCSEIDHIAFRAFQLRHVEVLRAVDMFFNRQIAQVTTQLQKPVLDVRHSLVADR